MVDMENLHAVFLKVHQLCGDSSNNHNYSSCRGLSVYDLTNSILNHLSSPLRVRYGCAACYTREPQEMPLLSSQVRRRGWEHKTQNSCHSGCYPSWLEICHKGLTWSQLLKPFKPSFPLGKIGKKWVLGVLWHALVVLVTRRVAKLLYMKHCSEHQAQIISFQLYRNSMVVY